MILSFLFILDNIVFISRHIFLKNYEKIVEKNKRRSGLMTAFLYDSAVQIPFQNPPLHNIPTTYFVSGDHTGFYQSQELFMRNHRDKFHDFLDCIEFIQRKSIIPFILRQFFTVKNRLNCKNFIFHAQFELIFFHIFTYN